MKQEFITVYGKVTVEKNTVFIRNVSVPFSQTLAAKVSLSIVFIGSIVLKIFSDRPRPWMGWITAAFLLIFYLSIAYDIFFKRSHSTRIPINKIKEIKVIEDNYGLEVFADLTLTSGRYRRIRFRKLENEHERFREFLQPSITHLQPA